MNRKAEKKLLTRHGPDFRPNNEDSVMASDFLLEIDGIKGESSDAKHKDKIPAEWRYSTERIDTI